MKRKLSLFLAVSMSLGMTNSVSAKEFTDTKGNWAENVIGQWSDYNVLGGYADGSFNPSGYITRAEVSAVIDKVMKYKVVGNNTFNDLTGNEWYANSMLKNVAADNINGYNGGVHGNDYITRQEVAAIICSAFDIAPVSGSTTFADDANIADWAKGSVKALQSAGYVNGRQGNKFAPKENITRAEVVAILDNIVETVFDATGTYSGNSEGNVLVNAEDVVLKDTTINGDLFVAAGVGEGDLTLDNVNVTGNVIVEGGGSHSVKFTNGSKAKEIKMQKNDNNTVRLYIDENSSVAGVATSSNAPILLEGKGNFGTVALTGTNAVTVAENTTIQQLVVKGGGNITNNGTVAQMVVDALAGNTVIKGAGQITALTVNNKGVDVDTKVATMVVTNENASVKVSDKVEKVQDDKGNDVKDKVTGTDSNNSGTNSNGNNSNNNSGGNNNNGGDSSNGGDDNTDGGNVNTDTTAPQIDEKEFYAYAITDTTAKINFKANEGGTYTYSVNDKATGAKININESGSNGFVLKNLKPETEYTIAVTLTDFAGNSATYTIKFTTVSTEDVILPPTRNIETTTAEFNKDGSTMIDLTDWFNYGSNDVRKVRVSTSKNSNEIDYPFTYTSGSSILLGLNEEDLKNAVVGSTYEINVRASYDMDLDGRADTDLSEPVILKAKIVDNSNLIDGPTILSSSQAITITPSTTKYYVNDWIEIDTDKFSYTDVLLSYNNTSENIEGIVGTSRDENGVYFDFRNSTFVEGVYTLDAYFSYGEFTETSSINWSTRSGPVHTTINVVADPTVEDIKGILLSLDTTEGTSGVTKTEDGYTVTSGSSLTFFPIDDKENTFTYNYVFTNIANFDYAQGIASGNYNNGVKLPTDELQVGEKYILDIYLVLKNQEILLCDTRNITII